MPIPTTHRLPLALALLVAIGASTALVVLRLLGDGDERDLHDWPFARDSIWNTAIGSSAEYVPAGLRPAVAADGAITVDPEHISMNPSAPLRSLRVPGQEGDGERVHVRDGLEHDGDWNGCTTLLAEDGESVWQGQPLELARGGEPGWRYTIPDRAVDLRGPGVEGCHGGSRMSGIGGSLRVGELEGDGPLRHALKINVYCISYCWQGEDQQDSKRWPALTADSYWDRGYGGRNPSLRMGALLAVPPDTDLSGITHPKARKIAEALRDYGGYVVDDTAWDVHALSADERMLDSGEWPDRDAHPDFHEQLMAVFTDLHVVDNNGPESVGGGGTPRAALAPCFKDEPDCR